jgi:hypothetical protein
MLMTLLLAVMAAGCASTQTIDVRAEMTEAEWAESIKPGDKVVVDTLGGKRMEFKVAVVEPGWIIGGGERVRREDISTLEVQRRGFNKWFAESKFDGGGIAYTVAVGVLVTLAVIAF